MNDKELMAFVGNRIKEERKKKNMTQKALGEKIGVAHNTISSYESGKNAPEQNAIFKIARVLGIKVDDLFPKSEHNVLDRLEELGEKLNIEEMAFLQELVEKTLSLNEEERERFLSNIKVAVTLYEDNSKK